MRDSDCVSFLQWALPRLGMRWPGFRKVRRQVCRRIAKRIDALGLADLAAYRDHLLAHEDEWPTLAALCRVTISRFWRDRGVFDHLAGVVLPRLAGEAATGDGRIVRCWCAGCASGEEPYSVALAWRLGPAGSGHDASLRVLGTDIDPALLGRARRGCYPEASLRELPAGWSERAFVPARDTPAAGAELCLRHDLRGGVAFACHDVRDAAPAGPFDLVLCRNLVFTYFDEPSQVRLAGGLAHNLRAGGVLLVGCHEAIPAAASGLAPIPDASGFYVRF